MLYKTCKQMKKLKRRELVVFQFPNLQLYYLVRSMMSNLRGHLEEVKRYRLSPLLNFRFPSLLRPIRGVLFRSLFQFRM